VKTRFGILITLLALGLAACGSLPGFGGGDKPDSKSLAATTVKVPQPKDWTTIGPAGYAVKCSDETIDGETFSGSNSEDDPIWIVTEINRLVGSTYADETIGFDKVGKSIKWYYRSMVFAELSRLNNNTDFRIGVDYSDPHFFKAPVICQLYKLKVGRSTTTSTTIKPSSGHSSNTGSQPTDVSINN
jgi:hypothetical protein